MKVGQRKNPSIFLWNFQSWSNTPARIFWPGKILFTSHVKWNNPLIFNVFWVSLWFPIIFFLIFEVSKFAASFFNFFESQGNLNSVWCLQEWQRFASPSLIFALLVFEASRLATSVRQPQVWLGEVPKRDRGLPSTIILHFSFWGSHALSLSFRANLKSCP